MKKNSHRPRLVELPPEPRPLMRSRAEIQAAHDAFAAIFMNEVPNPFADESKEQLAAAINVLCWVLHHDHNDAFAKNLAHMTKFFAAQGLELRVLRDPKPN